MLKFTGAFERQLDVKGRLALPPSFRTRFSGGCYLTLGADNSIEVFTAEAFEEEAERMEQRQARGEITMDRLRAFSASANAAEPDGQGRIYLDDRLRRHAKLEVKGPAMVFGRLDRVEICSVDRYERSMTNGVQSFAENGGASTIDQSGARGTADDDRTT
jgi:division/cell wall cluster transcriptional repressor MraZ